MVSPGDFDADLLAQLREDFLAESGETLSRLGDELATLDAAPAAELVNTIFREVHTLKGTAGFAGLGAMGEVAHEMENVFAAVRRGALPVTPAVVDACLAGLDALQALRAEALRGAVESAVPWSVVQRLREAVEAGAREPEPGRSSVAPVASAPGAREETGATAAAAPPAVRPAGEATMRVRVEALDTLLTLVGELVTARNALLERIGRMGDEGLDDAAAGIDLLTRRLEDAITSLRLVPVERLFARFGPVVRGLAAELGKEVRLMVEGGGTLLDRAILEALYDPLVHVLRNAVDHGLETAEQRGQAGKPARGTIVVAAERHGDGVVLRVTDDGRGLDAALLRRTAVERGLLGAAEAAALSDELAWRLIFLPGFSTARTVTALSGRGVGMDVVQETVRLLRGAVEVETTPGTGTTFLLRVPLTLAIQQVVLAGSAGSTYALPLHLVREIVYLPPGTVRSAQGSESAAVRERRLPVYHLDRLLGHPAAVRPGPCVGVVVPLPGGDGVIVVESLAGKARVVVKPLSPRLGVVPGVDGTALLPDGMVALILNPAGLLAPA